jgi:chromosome partitioning protein
LPLPWVDPLRWDESGKLPLVEGVVIISARKDVVKPMTHIITVANQKGGVGKTTTAVTLATGLAALGQAVVLVDADTQGSVAHFLGLAPRPDLYALVIQDKSAAEVVQRVGGYPTLGVVSGNVDTWEIEDSLGRGRRFRPVTALRDALERFGKSTIVVIDTAPALSHIQVSALHAADWLLIPAIPEYAAEAGVANLTSTVAALRESGGRVNLLGILPTMVDSRSREHRDTIEAWAKQFPNLLLPHIRRLMAYGEAPGEGVPIWTYRPEAAEDYARALVEVRRRLGLASRQVVKQ